MLSKLFDQEIKRRPLWWKDGMIVDSKPNPKDGWVYFPSLGEFRCFSLLQDIFDGYAISIHPHLRTSSLRWVVDFRIKAATKNQRIVLAKISNACNSSQYSELDDLYCEYKGYADKNFRLKINVLNSQNPSKASTLILLSREDSVYTLKNGKTLSVYSLSKFRDICNIYLDTNK